MIIDWLVSFAFISGPLVSAVFMGEVYAGNPLKEVTNYSYGCAMPVAEFFGVLAWTFAAMHIPPRRLMAAVVLSRFLLAVPSIIEVSPLVGGLSLGAITAGDMVFIYFNFMGKSVGDISRLATRMGFLIGLQKSCKFLFMPLTECIWGVRVAMAFLVAVLCLAVSLVLMKAPASYSNFCLPNFRAKLRDIRRIRVLMLLGLATIMRGLTYVPEMTFIVWHEKNPSFWRPLKDYYLLDALVAALLPVLLALVLNSVPNVGVMIVKAVACLSLPCNIVICCLAMVDAKNVTDLSVSFDMIIVLSKAIESFFVMASAVVVLATVGSRWRFAVYTCVVTALTALVRGVSFWILWPPTGEASPLEAAKSPKVLANQFFLASAVVCFAEFICRAFAFLFFDTEATSMWWTARQSKIVRLLGTGSSTTTAQP